MGLTREQRDERINSFVAGLVTAAREAGMVAATNGVDGIAVDNTGKVVLNREDKCGCALGAAALYCGASIYASTDDRAKIDALRSEGGAWHIGALAYPDAGGVYFEGFVKVPSWVDYGLLYNGNDQRVHNLRNGDMLRTPDPRSTQDQVDSFEAGVRFVDLMGAKLRTDF